MNRILIAIILLIGLNGYSQINTVFVLKNGSEIRGKLIEKTTDNLKIRTIDGSIWTYNMDEIAIIKKYQPKVSGKGIFIRANLGMMGGDQFSPSFHLINGYSFNSHWDLGFGVGLESLWWNGYVPLFVSGRYNLLNKTATPFVDVIVGYDMPISNWDLRKGGFTTGARIGFTKYTGNRLGISTSIGYRFAHLVTINSLWDDFRIIEQINRIDIRIGLTFK